LLETLIFAVGGAQAEIRTEINRTNNSKDNLSILLFIICLSPFR
jgi:hypothetical protein